MNLKLSKSIRKALLVSAVLSFPLVAQAVPGYYAQVQGGLSDWQGTDTLALKFSKNSPVFRASAGYLWANCNIPCWEYGWEVGASTYPHLKRSHADVSEEVSDNNQIVNVSADGSLSLDGYSIDLLGVLKYNFTPRFNAFAKAGVAYLNEQLTTKIQAIDQTSNLSYRFDGKINDHQYAPELMLGVAYRLTPKVEANLAISEVFAGKVSEDNLPVATTSSLMVGVAYYF